MPPPSSSGLGRRVLIPVTGVRVPYGVLSIDMDTCVAPLASRGRRFVLILDELVEPQAEPLVSEPPGRQHIHRKWDSAGTRDRKFDSLGGRGERSTADHWQPPDRQTKLLAVKVNRDAVNAPPDRRLPAIQRAIGERRSKRGHEPDHLGDQLLILLLGDCHTRQRFQLLVELFALVGQPGEPRVGHSPVRLGDVVEKTSHFTIDLPNSCFQLRLRLRDVAEIATDLFFERVGGVLPSVLANEPGVVGDHPMNDGVLERLLFESSDLTNAPAVADIATARVAECPKPLAILVYALVDQSA